MTDARMPDRWLSDRRLLRLSDAGHRLFVSALMFSVGNRTDGVLGDDDLVLIPRVDPACAAELVLAGLWQRDHDRWVMADFANTQTTAAQLAGLDHKRVMDRERQARNRANRGAGVTRDRPRDGTRDTEDRQGQARTGVSEAEVESDQDHDPWQVAANAARANRSARHNNRGAS